MKPTRPAMPAAITKAGAAHESQRAADVHDQVRRQAVLYRTTRFAHPQDPQPEAGPGALQASRRRARLPKARVQPGKAHESGHNHALPDEEAHPAMQGRGNGGGSGGRDGGEHSHSGGDGRDGGRARQPEVRTVMRRPVPPHTAGALPTPATTQMNAPEHADAVRGAFCEALLALRDNPGGSRVVGVAELQLDWLGAMQTCPSLREPEGMVALRQRLIDASADRGRKKDAINALLPLVLLMAARPLTPSRENESRNVLTLQRNAALARSMDSQ